MDREKEIGALLLCFYFGSENADADLGHESVGERRISDQTYKLQVCRRDPKSGMIFTLENTFNEGFYCSIYSYWTGGCVFSMTLHSCTLLFWMIFT